jgi:hypothetical protein
MQQSNSPFRQAFPHSPSPSNLAWISTLHKTHITTTTTFTKHLDSFTTINLKKKKKKGAVSFFISSMYCPLVNKQTNNPFVKCSSRM